MCRFLLWLRVQRICRARVRVSPLPLQSTLEGGVMMFNECNYLRPGAVLASSKPCLLLTRIDYWWGLPASSRDIFVAALSSPDWGPWCQDDKNGTYDLVTVRARDFLFVEIFVYSLPAVHHPIESLAITDWSGLLRRYKNNTSSCPKHLLSSSFIMDSCLI